MFSDKKRRPAMDIEHAPITHPAAARGESPRHAAMKASVARLFAPYRPGLEVRIGALRRADVVVGKTVVECQASPLSVAEWEARTRAYNALGYAVLWSWAGARIGAERIAPGWQAAARIPAELRNCHKMTYGRVYVMDDAGGLWSCHFDKRIHHEHYHSGGLFYPKTIRVAGFQRAPLALSRMTGPEGHILGQLGDGAWWKSEAAIRLKNDRL